MAKFSAKTQSLLEISIESFSHVGYNPHGTTAQVTGRTDASAKPPSASSKTSAIRDHR